MADILSEIVANTKRQVEERKAHVPFTEVEKAARKTTPPRDFAASLSLPGVRVIAECKKQSPSKGVMLPDYDPVKLATAYEKGGAAAISVLTDEKYFGGHLDHLKAVRAAVNLPLLRKDFIVDPYQIVEARAAGADTFLLLAGVLSQKELEELILLGRSFGMEPLVESHTDEQLDTALDTSAKILGINNRDLRTFTVDFDHAGAKVAKIRIRRPDGIPVCESGIRSPSDIERMASAGYSVFLVGETVATSADPEKTVADLVAVKS